MSLTYSQRKTRQLVDICRNLSIDTTNNRIGIGSTIPNTTLDISGDVRSTQIIPSGNVALTSTSSATDVSDSFDYSVPFSGNVDASAFVGFGTGLTGIGFTDIAYVIDQKGESTDGGTFTLGAWRTRDLNTKVPSDTNMVTLSSNKFTLGSGQYFIEWTAPASDVDQHVSQLYSDTDSIVVAQGTTGFCNDSSGAIMNNISVGYAYTNITSNNTYYIRHQCKATSSGNYGFGRDVGKPSVTPDQNSVYTQVKIQKF